MDLPVDLIAAWAEAPAAACHPVDPEPAKRLDPGSAAPPPPIITRPPWVRRPSPADVDRHYPPTARALGVEGRATLFCSVTAGGSLEACRIASESPEDHGFGEAALAMSGEFRMALQLDGGRSVAGASVPVPMTFRLPK